MTESLGDRFAGRMGQLLGPDFPSEIAVAVSGGGDSMALLHLAAGWARPMGIKLRIVTVDHGLRAESTAEAALVADEAAGLGQNHTILRWHGWDGTGNLQDAARQARLDLIGSWPERPAHVLMAHTQDDQAETLLMRLARGSGVEGLSAMAERREIPGPPPWEVLRPLLDEARADLRHYLTTLRIPFVDDPSNEDPKFERVRIRRLIGQEGLSTETLAATARRMARAREALARRAADVAERLSVTDPTAPGVVVLDRDGFADIEPDTQLRILAGALQFVASAAYRPREAPLRDALDRALSGGTATLHGGIVVAQGDRLFIAREHKAVADTISVLGHDDHWDSRWTLSRSPSNGLEVRALGDAGLRQLSTLPKDHAPRPVLASLPAVFRDVSLVACPPLGLGESDFAELLPPQDNFPAWLLAH